MKCPIELHHAAQQELTEAFQCMKNVHQVWLYDLLRLSAKGYLNYHTILTARVNERLSFVKHQQTFSHTFLFMNF